MSTTRKTHVGTGIMCLSVVLVLGGGCNDTPRRNEAGAAREAGALKEAGAGKDAGAAREAGALKEAGAGKDAGGAREAGALKEAGKPSQYCGDKSCNNGETCSTCPGDCGSCSSSLTYSTNFDTAEDPIAEGNPSKWINGQATGVDWTNVKTSDGNATGTQFRDTNQYYDDSVAILKGNWGPDQTLEATVYSANQNNGGSSGFGGNGNSVGDPNCNKEVELILRGHIAPNSIYLYEVNFSSRIDGTAYAEVGKWGGARGNFPWGYLSRKVDNTTDNCDAAGGCGVTNGDVVKATISGNTIKVYKNNILINTVTDTVDPITSGSPGIAMYSSAGCTGTAHNDDFGFTSFTATDAP
jgi:hypothetical protein